MIGHDTNVSHYNTSNIFYVGPLFNHKNVVLCCSVSPGFTGNPGSRCRDPFPLTPPPFPSYISSWALRFSCLFDKFLRNLCTSTYVVCACASSFFISVRMYVRLAFISFKFQISSLISNFIFQVSIFLFPFLKLAKAVSERRGRNIKATGAVGNRALFRSRTASFRT